MSSANPEYSGLRYASSANFFCISFAHFHTQLRRTADLTCTCAFHPEYSGLRCATSANHPTLPHAISPLGEPHLHTCISSANPEYSGLRCAASAIDQFSIHRLIIITPLSIISLLSGSNSLSARIILLSRYPLQLLAALWLAAGFPLLSGLGEKVALRLAF